MEIEELFCKRYPEYSVNGKPLHPYFDVFEEGYEQAEKENAELKERLAETNLNGNIVLRELTKANLLLKDVYKIAMEDWNDPKCHDQVLRKAREYLKEIEK